MSLVGSEGFRHWRGAALCAALLCGSAAYAQAVPGSAGSVHDRGAALFQEKGCAHCHGVEGQGTAKGPALKRMRKSKIEKQIRFGGKEMPAFGDVLNEDEMKALVEFVRAHKSNGRDSNSGESR